MLLYNTLDFQVEKISIFFNFLLADIKKALIFAFPFGDSSQNKVGLVVQFG